MAEAPDFRNLDAAEYRKVLAAGNVTPGQFLSFSPDQQSVVWGNCWDLHSEILNYDYEAPTSASAMRENAQRKEERRQEVQRESEKQQEQLQKKKPSLDDLKAIAKASAKKKPMPSLDDLKPSRPMPPTPPKSGADYSWYTDLMEQQTARQAPKPMPSLDDLEPSRRNGEISDSQRSPEEFDIELLWGEWLEKKKQASSQPIPPVEQLWPNLPQELLADLKRRIEVHLKKLEPFIECESEFEDGQVDLELEDEEPIADPPTLRAGFTLPYSSWILTERLGNGGFGEVWKAQHKRFGLVGVCKFPRIDSLNRNAFESVENEARLVMQLNHPGIVKLKETHLDLPVPFIVFEFETGKDLAYTLFNLSSEPAAEDEKESERHKSDFKELTPDEAACVMLKIVDSIAAAHSASPAPILHRDLKPENILVTNYDDLAAIKSLGITPDIRLAEFKILDFGIGGFTTDGRGVTTGAQSLGRLFDKAGSPSYGSPQRRNGEPPVESDDVYDLGLIWRELLEGEFRLDMPTGGQWRARMRKAGATNDQITVLAGCLEETRKHRIANAVELAKSIRQAYPEAADPETSQSELLDRLIAQLPFSAGPIILTPATAQILANKAGYESLSLKVGGKPNLEDVLLATIFGNGSFTVADWLETLSPEIARALAQFGGNSIVLDDLKTLSPETAQALVQFGGYAIDLNDLEILDPETARGLAQFGGGHIGLNGLESLDPETAQLLAQFGGRHIELKGLEALSPESAQALAQFGGDAIYLTGLESLDPETAQALAQFGGESIWLSGLEALSPETARALGQFGGKSISLSGLQTLCPEIAQVIVRFGGERIRLDCLDSLDPETAQVLAQFGGKSISLWSLETLSLKTAQALAQFGGEKIGFMDCAMNIATVEFFAELPDIDRFHLGEWRDIIVSYAAKLRDKLRKDLEADLTKEGQMARQIDAVISANPSRFAHKWMPLKELMDTFAEVIPKVGNESGPTVQEIKIGLAKLNVYARKKLVSKDKDRNFLLNVALLTSGDSGT